VEDKNKKPVVMPGCIGCGLCESIVPDVFQVRDVSRVREGIDYEQFKDKIERAIRSCPVGVIRWEK
jgi:ferredoxin